MLEHDLPKLEAMVAEAEAQAYKLISAAGIKAGDQPRRDRMASIVLDALGLTDPDRSEIEALGIEHDSELRRVDDDAKRRALDGAGKASERLDELARAERVVLGALPGDDWRNPWVPSWPPVYFIRSTPGGSIPYSLIDDGDNRAKWQCSTPSISGGREKLSFFHLWQNPNDTLAIADISVRLNVVGHVQCSAEGWGIPAGWFSESRSEADLSAQLAVWPLWLPADASQRPDDSVPLARLTATAGVLSDSNGTSVTASVLVKTARYVIPANGFILIEASVVLDHSGGAEADFASGDYMIKCPTCFVILPTDINMNL